MHFKKVGKQIFGVSFTEKEQAIIDMEIEKMAHEKEAEYLEEFESNIDAQLLWFLHKHEGHGKERLLRDFRDFAPFIRELIDYYEMPESEGSFLAKEKLKDLGVDIDKLRSEDSGN